MSEKTEGIKEKLNKVFRAVLKDDGIDIFDKTRDVKDAGEWDSLSQVLLVVAIEKEFGFKLGAADAGKLEDPEELLRAIESRDK